MLAARRISRLSWILTGGYLLCGVMFFVLVRKVAFIFSELQPPLMLPTRVLLWVGPSGWLALMVFLAALIVSRDVGFRSHLLKPVITVGLCVALGGVLVAVACLGVAIFLQPICVFRSTISLQ